MKFGWSCDKKLKSKLKNFTSCDLIKIFCILPMIQYYAPRFNIAILMGMKIQYCWDDSIRSIRDKGFVRSHLLIPATKNIVLLKTSLRQDGPLLWWWSLFNFVLWSKPDSAVWIACSPSLDWVSDCRLGFIPPSCMGFHGLEEKFSAHIIRKHNSYI